MHGIETHRFRRGPQPETIEAKCLHDADKLDVLGAVGIARSYLFLGEVGGSLLYKKSSSRRGISNKYTNSVQEEYEIKYKHLPGRMLTNTGRRIASERLKYMKSFLNRLEKENIGLK